MSRLKNKSWILRWVIASVLLVLMYILIKQKLDLQLFDIEGLQLRIDDLAHHYIVIALLLMPINWLLESAKWKTILGNIDGLKSYKSIYLGITAGLFTPHRIGEYIGRNLLLEKQRYAEGLSATVVGGIAQMVATFIFGFFAVLLLGEMIMEIPTVLTTSYLFMVLIVSAVFLLIFFQTNNVLKYLSKFRLRIFDNYFRKYAGTLLEVSSSDLGLVLMLSVLRYLIYSLQYLFVMKAFHIEASLIEYFASISTMLLIQSSIPLPVLLGVAFKVEVAVFIWSFLGANGSDVFLATLTMWCINLVVPAVIGISIFLFEDFSWMDFRSFTKRRLWVRTSQKE